MRAAPPLALAMMLPLLLPASLADAPALPAQGPEAPALSAAVASVVVLSGEAWSFTAGWRGADVVVPGGWDRVLMNYTQHTDKDPWDRLFAASIAGVEVLRGTTPRTNFTISKEVTRYAALLQPGATVRVEAYTDTWVGGTSQFVTLTLDFYSDGVAPDPAAGGVAGAQRFAGMCLGSTSSVQVDFGAGAPGGATLELFTSSHGQEEFWWTATIPKARHFSVRVDGVQVAQVVAMPYSYAFLGFAGANGQMGPTHHVIHQAMWWTAHRALDGAGVHGGVGEIPPYRATLSDAHAALLTGVRTVDIQLEGLPYTTPGCVWVTSASFVLDP